jgi:hypothetical protein
LPQNKETTVDQINEGRPRTDVQHERWSEWCDIFREYADAKNLTNTEIARRAGLKSWLVHAYMTGRVYPPVDAERLGAFAEALELNKEQRAVFELEAGLANAPESLRKRFRAMSRKVDALTRENEELRSHRPQASGSEPEIIST